MNQTITSYLVKPLMAGGVGSIINNYMFPSTNIKYFGKSSSLTMFTFASVAGGSILSSLMHDYVFPHIPVTNKLSQPITELVAMGTIFASNLTLHYLANSRSLAEIGLATLLIESAASEVISDYLTHRFVGPVLSSWM